MDRGKLNTFGHSVRFHGRVLQEMGSKTLLFVVSNRADIPRYNFQDKIYINHQITLSRTRSPPAVR